VPIAQYWWSYSFPAYTMSIVNLKVSVEFYARLIVEVL